VNRTWNSSLGANVVLPSASMAAPVGWVVGAGSAAAGGTVGVAVAPSPPSPPHARQVASSTASTIIRLVSLRPNMGFASTLDFDPNACGPATL
jgi:hypothetical protein